MCQSVDKATEALGLKLLDEELNNLKSGNYVSLGRQNLGELGTLFIFASALSGKASGDSNDSISFHDLPQINANSKYRLGIPIYCWQDADSHRCLCLTLVGGEPAVFVSG
ncbi:MAG: hypothetical protein AAGF93_02910 [Cyanobacteria bacterium P01_H01_bin.105]